MTYAARQLERRQADLLKLEDQHIMTGASRRRHRLLVSAPSAFNLALLRQEEIEKGPARLPDGAACANEDFLTERAGVRCAGAHLIVDLYGAHRLDDLAHIEGILRRCVEVAGASLLHMHLHPFASGSGVSGVAVLAESHSSIHTWPELGYAAFDMIMCGKARPQRCIEVLLEAFVPRRVAIEELLRGRLP